MTEVTQEDSAALRKYAGLSHAWFHLHAQIVSALRERGLEGEEDEVVILNALHLAPDNRMTVADICQLKGRPRSTVNLAVKKLSQRELITLGVHGRETLVILNVKGEEYLSLTAPVVAIIIQRALEKVPKVLIDDDTLLRLVEAIIVWHKNEVLENHGSRE